MAQIEIHPVRDRAGNQRAVKIRKDLLDGVLTNAEIARKHGVSPACVSLHFGRMKNGRQVPKVGRGCHRKGVWSLKEECAVYCNSNGIEVTLDVSDFPAVSSGGIGITTDEYGYQSVYFSPKGERKRTPLGRYLLGLECELVADHIDGDPLNNRRSNLRACSRGENNWNRKAALSRFKGVSRSGHSWQAKIHIAGADCAIGYFETEEAAAQAYDDFARQFYGQFARLNFPQDGEQPARREASA